MEPKAKPLVLIVDDNPTNIKTLIKALRDNYELGIASSGQEALEYIEGQLPDLILLDVLMPGMDGFSVCSRVNSDERTKDIPVIFITALDELSDKAKGFKAGGVDYITKPFDKLDVRARVKTHIALKQAKEALKRHNETLISIVDERTKQLRHLLNMTLILNSELNINRIFDPIISEVGAIMKADRGTLFLLNPETNELWSKVAEGVESKMVIPLPKGLVGKSAFSGEPLIVDDAYGDPAFDDSWDQRFNYRTKSVLCYPVRNRANEFKGVLEVVNKLTGRFNEDDLGLAASCAAQIGVAIETHELFAELKNGFESFVRTLARAIEAKHLLTIGHSHRVTEYSLFLGSRLGLSENDLEIIKYAGLLHDIGKIGVTDVILTKKGRFNPEEREAMNQHPIWTFRILEEILLPRILREIPRIAACHHEKFNGEGYPYGLKGEAIPFFSRILAVADVFDALTSDRDYPKYDGTTVYGYEPLVMDKAFAILDREQYSHFDPKVISVVLDARTALEELCWRLHTG